MLTEKICADAERKEVHLKTVDLVFSDKKSEAENRLLHSITEMDKGLAEVGITQYDIDNLAETLVDVYDYEQNEYFEKGTFKFLSLVGMALLELGLIVEEKINDG